LIRRYGPAAAFAIALAAYFLYFNRDALGVRFAPDDMMNLSQYFHWPRWQVWIAQIEPWRGFYRPLAGVFYMPLLYLFGLNPRPYHAALLAIGLAALWLVYVVARQLGAGRIAAMLSVFLLAYHGGISNIYWDIAFVYDALCGLFYFAALAYYIRLRQRAEAPDAGQVVVFLTLFLCALNAKEMAATLPAVLLIYEGLYRPKNVRVMWPVPGFAFALDAVFAYGRLVGPAAMTQSGGYVMVFSRERLVNFQIQMLSDLSMAWRHIGWVQVLVVYAVALVVVVLWGGPPGLRGTSTSRPGEEGRPQTWRSAPLLPFLFVFVLVTPLPIEFLQGRAQATLFIPAVGAAVFVAVVFVELVELLGLRLAGEIGIRGRAARIVPVVALAAAFYWWFTWNREVDRLYVRPAMDELGGVTYSLIQQFDAMHPEVRPHGTIVFLDDPFDGWDMQFITQLWFRDPSLKILLQRKTPLTPRDIAQADRVFNAAGGKLVLVR